MALSTIFTQMRPGNYSKFGKIRTISPFKGIQGRQL